MSKALFKSVSVVSLMTFISRILGFARDLIAAQIFGVNAAVDAFYIAFKIPNFMRNLFAEGAFSQAFVPVLSEYRQNKQEAETLLFVNRIFGLLGLILCFVTVIGVSRASDLITIFSPGLDPLRFKLSTQMLKITFPYLMLISLAAFSGSVLNSYNRFAIPALVPALLNIVLIISALFYSKKFIIPVESQAWAVFVAGIAQLLVQILALYKIGVRIKPKISFKDPGVFRVLKLMVPAIFGASISQISILINTVLASFLITGSITWLYYSERLAYFPLGIFGVALATVLLPHLSRQHAKASNEEFTKALAWGIRWNLIIGLPASLAMLILSGPLIVSLFGYGKFGLADVLMTQKSVIAYAIGLQAFMLIKVLSSGFYARREIKIPVKISAQALVVNIIFSLILIKPLEHAGLALSTSLGSWFSVIMLLYRLHKLNLLKDSNFIKYFSALILINFFIAIFLYYNLHSVDIWISWSWQTRLLQLSKIGGVSLGLYILAIKFFRII